MNKIGRFLLYPFSLLYGIIIATRNTLYDTGLLKETSFNLPVISVGNLSVGGAGKTPHVEYLLQLLQPYIKVSVLSRGYKRKTKGFRMVQRNDTALISGDEPLQFKRKNPAVPVAVSESRALGIPQLIKYNPEIQTVLLDDAFQHRSVKPSLNILVTPLNNLYIEDWLLPAGRLREPANAATRADIIIVSKCNPSFSLEGSSEIIRKLNPLKHQSIYFTQYKYGTPYYIFNGKKTIPLHSELNVILISAIANTSYLKQYIEQNSKSINSMEYEDHHIFSDRDMNYLLKVFKESSENKTAIITTEKDAIRLQEHKEFIIEHNLPIFALPARVEFLFDQKISFDHQIQDFLTNFKV